MQITVLWGEEEVAVEVEAECRTLAALKALVQDALPEVDVGTVRLEVGGRELTDDDDVCGLEAGSVVELSATAAALAAATLREEGCEVDFDGLCSAAAYGNVRRCRLYLDAGVACIPSASGPLHQACSAYSISGSVDGRVAVVTLLLDRGWAIDEKARREHAPLHRASKHNQVEIACLLLDRGAAIDAEDEKGGTPLHTACEYNRVEMARLLLDRGADPSKRKSNSVVSSPLQYACDFTNLEVATLLVDRGAAIDADVRDILESAGIISAARAASASALVCREEVHSELGTRIDNEDDLKDAR